MNVDRIEGIKNASELSGLDQLNQAVREASILARNILLAPTVIIDTEKPLVSVRNFTKALSLVPHGASGMYALIKIEESQEKS